MYWLFWLSFIFFPTFRSSKVISLQEFDNIQAIILLHSTIIASATSSFYSQSSASILSLLLIPLSFLIGTLIFIWKSSFLDEIINKCSIKSYSHYPDYDGMEHLPTTFSVSNLWENEFGNKARKKIILHLIILYKIACGFGNS